MHPTTHESSSPHPRPPPGAGPGLSRAGALLLATLAAAPPAGAQFSFQDRTDLLSVAGIGREFNSGVAMAVADMDGDGRDDIVRLHDSDTLSLEYQRGPGEAFDHQVYGAVAAGSTWAACVADVDHDGRNDILLGGASRGLELLRSKPGGFFQSTILPDRDIFSQGIIFADIDNDGLLDIFACDDNDDPHKYRNLGGGRFALEAGLLPTSLPGAQSGNYAALWTDYDGDGDGDLYLSKCRQGVNSPADGRRVNRLFINGGGGQFGDVAPLAGLADGSQTWCTDFADIDNDGDLDAFILNHGPTPQSRLMLSRGNGTFTEITAASGLLPQLDFYGIQALFRDFDNDGFVDLLVATGNLEGTAATYRLFHNQGNNRFVHQPDLLRRSDGSALSYIQSFAVGDLNHDGFLDIYAGRASGLNTPSSARDRLFFNTAAGNGNGYLAVQLTGRVSNRNGVGARLEAHGPWGVQVREVRAGEGYGIANTFTQHFGLGAADAVERLVVRWPSGIVDTLEAVAGDQFLQVEEASTLGPEDFDPPVITGDLRASASERSPFTYRVPVDNLPLGFALGEGTPAGMAIDATTGIVTWVPTAQGEFTAEVTASNPAGEDRATLVIVVGPNSLANALDSPSSTVETGDPPWALQTEVVRDGEDAARSGDTADGGTSWIEVGADGPDGVIFWWKVSSERNFDYLRFLLDGAEQAAISGEVDWTRRVVPLGQGHHTLRWEYSKDGSAAGGQDRAWLDEVSLASSFPEPVIISPAEVSGERGLPFRFQLLSTRGPVSFSASPLPAGLALDPATGLISGTPAEAGTFTLNLAATGVEGTGEATLRISVLEAVTTSVDAPGLAWTSGGDAPWAGQTSRTHDGVDAARSGDIGDRQTSWLETALEGPGTLSFWWRVSSEEDFDFLVFEVDGSVRSEISGESGWRFVEVDILDGSHRARWSYEKDDTVSEGSDAGWLDEVVFTQDDGDEDGLPDPWERLHFGDLLQVGDADTDGDGRSNRQEFLAGTNPADPASRFALAGLERTPGTVRLHWQSIPGRAYRVESSSDLVTWDATGDPLEATATSTAAEVPAPTQGSAFWRITVDP